MIAKLAGKALDNPIQVAIGLGLVLGVVYFLSRKTITDVAAAAGGVVSGDNWLTQGTPYQNKGVVGTVASAANSASGGALQSIGEALGGWLFDVTHQDYDPSSGFQSAAKTVSDGGLATDQLWGRIGNVDLRHGY